MNTQGPRQEAESDGTAGNQTQLRAAEASLMTGDAEVDRVKTNQDGVVVRGELYCRQPPGGNPDNLTHWLW